MLVRSGMVCRRPHRLLTDSLSLSPRIGDLEIIKSLIMPFVYAALDSDLGFNLSAPINTS
jgi:hypothetical protein